jgi:penicillin-binding protein 1A
MQIPYRDFQYLHIDFKTDSITSDNQGGMMKKKLKKFLVIIPGILVLPLIFVFFVSLGSCGHLQSKAELLNFRNATATIVLSSEDELIGRIFSENRTNVSFRQIPPDLINALIATEDSRFYEHKGIDSRSLFRVFFKSLLLNKSNSGGGSTISQQLAKNMFGRKNSGLLSILVTKTKEAILARRLEKTFTKDEILTFYLNTVSFGENIYGIETASLQYFNKKVGDLKIEESAVLIGMLKANTLYNPRLHPENAMSRRNVVLKQMEKYNYLNPSSADSLCKLPLILNYGDIFSEGPADYFIVRVKKEAEQILQDIHSSAGKEWNIEQDGLIITTTLNLTLQKAALESFREHLQVMQERLWAQYKSNSGKKALRQIADQELKDLHYEGRAGEINIQQIFDWNGSHTDSISVADSLKQALLILHAGFLAIDPVTGAVRAWVGGIDFKTQPYDQIHARRQMASVFKPILYAEAFEDGFEPCQYLDNDSIVISTDTGEWSPENYDRSTGGKYSLAGALAHSMNIPTFNLFTNLGYEKLDSLWKKMGFSFPLVNNPSLALGTAEASLIETAVAYSSFANGGFRVTPQSISSIKTHDGEIIWQNEFSNVKERVLAERSAVLISAILQKAIREGTGSSMSSVYGVNLPMAGKTGTSQDYSDAWFAAFNPKLVLVTRVGASSRAIHFNNGSDGSGSSLALPLVALTLKKVQGNNTLTELLIVPFPDLPAELNGALDCPDFKEKNILDKVRDLFQNKKAPGQGDDKPKQKKKGFFKRLFGK